MFDFMKLLRYGVAYVFIISGVMKLAQTEITDHFLQLGLPFSEALLYIVAITELLCGICIALSKFVRLATVPLLLIMICAVLITKIPLLHDSFLTFAFQARLDIVMLLILLFLYSNQN